MSTVQLSCRFSYELNNKFEKYRLQKRITKSDAIHQIVSHHLDGAQSLEPSVEELRQKIVQLTSAIDDVSSRVDELPSMEKIVEAFVSAMMMVGEQK